MLFSIQKELFDIVPDLTIGMVVARDVDNTRPSKEIDDLLTRAVEEMKKNFIGDKAQEHPRIKPWRTAFSKLAISGSKFPSSIESMARRVLKGDPFPKINPLVDLYNSVSLRYSVPMGGHDLDTIEGNIYLGFAEGWEPFSPMGGGEAGLFLPSAWYCVDFEGIAGAVAEHGSFYPSMHFSWHFDEVNHELTRPVYMQAALMADLFKGGWTGGWDSTGGRSSSTARVTRGSRTPISSAQVS